MSSLKNTVINDTGYIQLPSGNDSQRPGAVSGTAAVGMIRYNSQRGNLETYTSAGNWGGLEPPPNISGISGVINQDINGTITINGNNFISGAVVTVQGAAVSNVDRILTTTFVSSNQLTAATASASVNYVAAASYNIKVTNPSGNYYILPSAGAVDREPTWSTSAGNLGTIYNNSLSGRTFTVSASDADGNTISYAVTSGVLPPNMSLNGSTGVISGTPNAVGSDTTYSFGITPTAAGYSGLERSFNIIVKAPIVQSFTAVGSTTFNVPVGVSSAQVVVVAGGGGGGTRNSGGASGGTDGGSAGGAGGMIDHPAYPLTPGGSVPVTVGGGGGGGGNGYGSGQTPGQNGSNSVFDALTALGGGYGGCGPLSPNPGGPGGSGGGEGGGGGTTGGTAARGTGLQPSQPGASGTYGYGNPGGYSSAGGTPPYTGSGGGGAGGGGSNGNGAQIGNGGVGRSTSVSGSPVYYAGGGGGGSFNNGGSYGPASGGTGGGGPGGLGNGANGTDGSPNTGGGGGGGPGGPGGSGGYGGKGGSGIVIIRY